MTYPEARQQQPPFQTYADVTQAALDILARNWIGHATRPGKLYPHQWSWDAATIAMGRVAWDQNRAEQELRSLFAAQWGDGLLPHIVFTDAERYFPGPSFWQAERSPRAPRGLRTSGIVQPPLHATAVWRMYLRSADRRSAMRFAADMVPKLTAWHEYLYRERVRDDDALVEIWHPWESGNDDSPSWDEALARISLTAEQMPAYERWDTVLSIDPEQRPSDFQYDRYAYLVTLLRDCDYDNAVVREECPFVMQPVLFNAVLVQANRDLANLARVTGHDPSPYEAWADATASGMEKLWDDTLGMYVDYDVRAKKRVGLWTAAGFSALYAGMAPESRAARVMERLITSKAPLSDDNLWAVPSISADSSHFRPGRYWRGPVWPLFQWMAAEGMARYGANAVADQIRRTAIELARKSDIWEHYNPMTGRGQGDPQFSWSAGFILDILAGPPRVDQ